MIALSLILAAGGLALWLQMRKPWSPEDGTAAIGLVLSAAIVLGGTAFLTTMPAPVAFTLGEAAVIYALWAGMALARWEIARHGGAR